jgi:hypothetical protein
MALTRVHTVNASGALVGTHLEGPGTPDDDGAPTNLPPGTRVTKDGVTEETSASPSEAEVAARRAALAAAPKPRRVAAAKAEATPTMSDRRLCLELALKSDVGGDPDAILAAARKFAAFLEGAAD